MNVRFLAIARHEVDDAVAWYEAQAAGLSRDFLDEMDRAIRRAVAFPHAGAEIEPGVRRCLLARFPYGILYGVDRDIIIVFAVAHLHREPRYWIDRF